jgi:hypothetical protein
MKNRLWPALILLGVLATVAWWRLEDAPGRPFRAVTLGVLGVMAARILIAYRRETRPEGARREIE